MRFIAAAILSWINSIKGLFDNLSYPGNLMPLGSDKYGSVFLPQQSESLFQGWHS
jgi:hypothetical protein